jgi:hypothetical protein
MEDVSINGLNIYYTSSLQFQKAVWGQQPLMSAAEPFSNDQKTHFMAALQ